MQRGWGTDKAERFSLKKISPETFFRLRSVFFLTKIKQYFVAVSRTFGSSFARNLFLQALLNHMYVMEQAR
jgi:hypothetical protein